MFGEMKGVKSAAVVGLDQPKPALVLSPERLATVIHVIEDTVFHSDLPCVVAPLDSKRRFVGTANQRDIFSHAWQPSAIRTRDGVVFGQLCGVRHGWTVRGRTADQ